MNPLLKQGVVRAENGGFLKWGYPKYHPQFTHFHWTVVHEAKSIFGYFHLGIPRFPCWISSLQLSSAKWASEPSGAQWHRPG